MFKLIKRMSNKEYVLIFFTIILVLIQSYLELLIPDFMAEVTRLVQTPGSNISNIWMNGLYMLLTALASLAVAIGTGYLIAYISSIFSYNIRDGLFNKIQNLSQGDIDGFTTSSLITRTTNDVTQIEMFMAMGMMIIIKSPIMAVLAVSKIIGKGLEWSMATGISVLIMIVVMILLIKIVVPKFKLVQELIDKLNDVSRENLIGIRVVRAFNANEYQEKKISKVNDDLTSLSKFTQKSFAIIQPMMFMNMYVLTLIIYLIGAKMISEYALPNKIETFGNMIVFSSYSMQVIMSFLMVGFLVVMYSRSSVSARRINEVFDTEESIKDGTLEASPKSDLIEFKNVGFKYPDAQEYVLKNINFSAKKGETVAFIGQTGSGKSTLIKLLPRLYDVTSGEILIDGVNINEFTLRSLNNKLGYVPQKAVMFNMSVMDNTRFGDSYYEENEEDLKESIRVAQAKDFVEEMDNGYDSMIARGGTNVSGGQKQRLSIARAIARKPGIYIFDDTFSALDFKTESTLRKELERYTKEAITFIVASRVGTVMNADKIVLLNDGEIDSIGTHKELWESSNLYREIVLSQLSEEEINASIR